MIQVSNNIFLKPVSVTDSSIIFNAIDKHRVYLREWLPFINKTINEDYTLSFIESSLANDEKQYLIYCDNHFGGLIGLNNTDKVNNKTEIGYWLCEDMQGKGLILQSISKLLTMAFNDLKMNKVTIKAGISNYKSRKIPEKLNFIFEGIERDAELLSNNKYTDLAIYSLLRREYKR